MHNQRERGMREEGCKKGRWESERERKVGGGGVK